MNNKKRDCFATLAMTRQKAFAFTLSEVLIVLAVLGVVAAMTIPDLIQDYREKALITALKKNYTIFSQAFDMAVAENGTPDSWGLSGTDSELGALNIYNTLKPYLKIEKTCGTREKGCFAEHYEALFNDDYMNQPNTATHYAKGILASGASFFTHSRGANLYFSGNIGVDVNGKAGPNKAGVDFFYFRIFKDHIEPAGQRRVDYGYESVCAYNNAFSANGTACTYWAIKHENMDYLRKDGKYVGY